MDKRMDYFSSRVKNIPPSTIRKLVDRAAQMKNVVSLTSGDPDFDTPEHVKEAAMKALRENITHYTSSYGLMELREAIAEKLHRENKVEVDPKSEIVVTSGGSEAILITMLTLLDPGDEVLLPDPAYPAYEPCVKFAGGVPVRIPLLEEGGFNLDPDSLPDLITPRTKLLVLVSPDNPTGSVASSDYGILKRVAEIIESHDLLVFSDEIYEKIVFDGKEHHSIASLPGMKERTVGIGGISKTYAMTGWRLGYIFADKLITDQIIKVHMYGQICAPVLAQRAAIAALIGPQDHVVKMVDEYQRRRDVVTGELGKIPAITCVKPKGTFFAFPNISKTGMTSDQFCEFLVDKYHLFVVPGTTFGRMGEGFVRITFANSIEIVLEGLSRFRQGVEDIQRQVVRT